MTDKELSDLKLERKECPKCGAIWLNGQHIWNGTGAKGDEEVLNNLVCSKFRDGTCINPKARDEMYANKDSWAKRLSHLEKNHPSTNN